MDHSELEIVGYYEYWWRLQKVRKLNSMSCMKCLCLGALAVATLSGCVTAPTWVNRGPVDLDAWNGQMNCYTDANIIDGKRVEGTICATDESGFFGGGEPEVFFGPWNRKFMKEYASATTSGVAKDWEGKKVLLQCAPTLATDNKTVTKRFCKVTVNDQLLVSATVKYVQ